MKGVGFLFTYINGGHLRFSVAKIWGFDALLSWYMFVMLVLWHIFQVKKFLVSKEILWE